jgi:CBS domain-containing protein
MGTLTVQDFLGETPPLLTICRTESVSAAAAAMAQAATGSILVVDADGDLQGIFTERDVLGKVVGAGRDPDQTPVGEVMTAELISCRPDTPLTQAQRLMLQHNIRHLPIVDGARPWAVLSSRDVQLHHMAAMQGVAQKLHNILEHLSEMLPGLEAVL